MIFINMAKIRITESQYKVIKESENVIDDFRTSTDDAIKLLNAQFGRLAFATMADVMDGDVDLDVIERKIAELDSITTTKLQRVTTFFKTQMTDDEYYDNWVDVDTELDDKARFVTKKIESIQILIEHMRHIADIDVENNFPDIETRKI